MWVRTITAVLVPGKADEAARIFAEQIIPEIRQQPGYVSTAIYIDREHHKAQTVSVWESRADVEATSTSSHYLGKVTGMLRGCLVNKEFDQWEVAAEDHV